MSEPTNGGSGSRAGAEEPRRDRGWVPRLILILSVVGLALAIYLTIAYSTNRCAPCAGAGGGDIVRSSQYVTIIKGLLSVPSFGVIGYSVIIMLALLRGRLGDKRGRLLVLLTYGAALVGFLYSALYLSGVELLILHAWCFWCIASAIVVTAIFVFSIVDLRRTWFG